MQNLQDTSLICMDKEEAMHNLHFEVRSKTDTAVMDFPWNNRGKELPIPLVVFTVNRNPTEQEYEAAVEQYRKRISQVEKSR